MMKELKKLFETIRTIGVDRSMSLYRQKIIHIFNILCVLGFIAATIQCVAYYRFDQFASYCHLAWGCIALLCLPLHKSYGFRTVRFLLFTPVFILGGYASARLGSDTYSHFGVLGIYIAIFIYFDFRKEWGYLLFYFLLATSLLILIESNLLKVAVFTESQLMVTRICTLVPTLFFVSVEVIFLMQASWLNENSISEKLRKNNQELQQLNQEKTILLQEIHHRVKNNFQIISSLLKLQAAEIPDQHIVYAFDEAIQRIGAFSQLHEQLYKSECGSTVNLSIYLSDLVNSIVEHHGQNKKIVPTVQPSDLRLSTDQIVPVALIFNELISNSLKHAFANRPNGIIAIGMEYSSDNRITFMYSDNGEWQPPTGEYSFGLELVETLTEQLDGTMIRAISEAGTSYTLELPLLVPLEKVVED